MTEDSGPGGAQVARTNERNPTGAGFAPPAEPHKTVAKAATHERIVASATELFAENGFKGTSITAIARAAGVGRSTILWHFGSKEALFQEVCRQLFAPFRIELGAAKPPANAYERIVHLMQIYERFARENRQRIQAFVRWSLLGEESLRRSLREEILWLHEAFARLMAESLAEATERSRDTAVMGAALVALLDGSLLLDLVEGDKARAAQRRQGFLLIAERIAGAERLPKAADARDNEAAKSAGCCPTVAFTGTGGAWTRDAGGALRSHESGTHAKRST